VPAVSHLVNQATIFQSSQRGTDRLFAPFGFPHDLLKGKRMEGHVLSRCHFYLSRSPGFRQRMKHFPVVPFNPPFLHVLISHEECCQPGDCSTNPNRYRVDLLPQIECMLVDFVERWHLRPPVSASIAPNSYFALSSPLMRIMFSSWGGPRKSATIAICASILAERNLATVPRNSPAYCRQPPTLLRTRSESWSGLSLRFGKRKSGRKRS
jgi:hypothetical protein